MLDQLIARLASHQHLDPDTARLLLCDHVAPLLRSAGYLRAEYGFRIAWGHAGDDRVCCVLHRPTTDGGYENIYVDAGVCCVLHKPITQTHGDQPSTEDLYNVRRSVGPSCWPAGSGRKALPEELADAERAMAVVRIDFDDETARIVGELRPTMLPAEAAVELPDKVCNASKASAPLRRGLLDRVRGRLDHRHGPAPGNPPVASSPCPRSTSPGDP